MAGQLQKIIDLIRKTGGRLIVYDSSGNKKPYVVMSLGEYERLVIGYNYRKVLDIRSLTEQELLDKINRDIAIWKEEQSGHYSHSAERNFDQNYSPNISKNYFGLEDEGFPGDNELGRSFGEKSKKAYKDDDFEAGPGKKAGQGPGPWTIPSDRRQGAEEIIEEDRRYYIEE